jgi:hypothetical protein
MACWRPCGSGPIFFFGGYRHAQLRHHPPIFVSLLRPLETIYICFSCKPQGWQWTLGIRYLHAAVLTPCSKTTWFPLGPVEEEGMSYYFRLRLIIGRPFGKASVIDTTEHIWSPQCLVDLDPQCWPSINTPMDSSVYLYIVF